MNRVLLPMPAEADYVRSVGRHALPNVYHKEHFRKLMAVVRRAAAVVSLKSLILNLKLQNVPWLVLA